MENYRSLSDRELVVRCREGEERAWEEIVERYKRLVYSIPCKYGLPAEDTADIFQTIWLLLLENLHSLRDESKLSAWLITSTNRECWKRLRERKRLRPYAEGSPEDRPPLEPVDPAARPDQWLGDLEEQHRVRRGLQWLDERCRRLLYYIFYQRRTVSYKDISKMLHMPEASIGPTRARCLAKLKKILAKLGR